MRPVLLPTLALSLATALACAAGDAPPAALALDLAHTLDAPTGFGPGEVAVDGARDVLVVAFESAFGAETMEHELRFLRLSTGEPLRAPARGPGIVRSLTLSGDGALAVASGPYTDVRILAVDGSLPDRALPCQPDDASPGNREPTCLTAVDAAGKHVAVVRGAPPRRFAVVALEDGRTVCDLAGQVFEDGDSTVVADAGLAFAPDGALLLAFDGGPVRAFRVDGCAAAGEWPVVGASGLRALAVSSDGGSFLATDLQHGAWHVERSSGATLPLEGDAAYADISAGAAAIGPDGRLWRLARDNRIAVHDAHGALLGHVPWGGPSDDPRREDGPDNGAHLDDVVDFALDASGRWLVAARGGEGSRVRVFRAPAAP